MNLNNDGKIPVTVLSGFLGSGKTTVLTNILQNKGGLKVAVIVNDMSELNIDARLIANTHTLSRTDEKLVELSNGCICCTLREDLMIEVSRLAAEKKYDYLLIESTGISEPIPVAQTFDFVDENAGIALGNVARLDTMVTVVDCFNFFKDYMSNERLTDRDLTEDDSDNRTIVNLLTEQIEFANVILLNKTDQISYKDLGLLEAYVHQLNPEAKIYETTFGNIDPEQILNTHLFDFEAASQSAGWIKELNGVHTPESEEYGIGSFVFQAKKPFHPVRFWSFLNEEYPNNIIRAKGMFWLAAEPDKAVNFSQAGGSLRVESAGVWWASMPYRERMRYAAFIDNQQLIEERWSARWGDRVNELVFIGQDLDKIGIIEMLETCLLTEAEIEEYNDEAVFFNPFAQLLGAEA